MAYLLSLQPPCQVCGKPSTHEVFNTWNATLGKFCLAHAQDRLEQALEDEQRRVAYGGDRDRPGQRGGP